MFIVCVLSGAFKGLEPSNLGGRSGGVDTLLILVPVATM